MCPPSAVAPNRETSSHAYPLEVLRDCNQVANPLANAGTGLKQGSLGRMATLEEDPGRLIDVSPPA